MKRSSRPLKLHLGAFDCSVPGWINTDITPHMWIARIPFAASLLRRIGKITEDRYQAHRSGRFRGLRYLDLTRPLPFPNDTVAAVFSSHVFEHLFSDEAERLVREIHRVLVEGGVCRVVVPDLDQIVRSYDPRNPKTFLKAMFEVEQRSDVKNAHHWGYTGLSLIGLFERAGFSQCYVTEFGKGTCPDIDKLDNRPGSIFFEAIK
jgi:predicted SAM-dependent methyltransferase